MKRPTDRRTVLKAAGAAAVAAAAGPVAGPAAAQSTDINGAVTSEGGVAIPEGQLDIALEDPAIPDKATRRLATTRVHSDGKSKAIEFSLSAPAGMTASPTLRIVARLERADGWLLARGSAQVKGQAAVEVRLRAVVY